MRYLVLISSMFLVSLSAFSALADVSDLSNGVFIAHYVPAIGWTEDPCEAYEAYAISSAEEQLNRIDTDSLSTWYVLSAWCEEKEFCGVQFGFGDYDPTIYAIIYYGACCPAGYLELPSGDWPGPDEGTAFTTTGIPWTDNYVPVYYFAGYAYSGETVIPLGPDQTVPSPFGGWANCEYPAGMWDAVAFGGMGIHTAGIYAAPPGPSPSRETSWGAIKTLYR